MVHAFGFAFSTAFDALLWQATYPLTLVAYPDKVKSGDVYTLSLIVNGGANGDLSPVDLTGSTVRLLALNETTREVYDLPAFLGNATGEVTHQLDGTLPAAFYYLEVEVSIAGAVFTAPSPNYTVIQVVPDLD